MSSAKRRLVIALPPDLTVPFWSSKASVMILSRPDPQETELYGLTNRKNDCGYHQKPRGPLRESKGSILVLSQPWSITNRIKLCVHTNFKDLPSTGRMLESLRVKSPMSSWPWALRLSLNRHVLWISRKRVFYGDTLPFCNTYDLNRSNLRTGKQHCGHNTSFPPEQLPAMQDRWLLDVQRLVDRESPIKTKQTFQFSPSTD